MQLPGAFPKAIHPLTDEADAELDQENDKGKDSVPEEQEVAGDLSVRVLPSTSSVTLSGPAQAHALALPEILSLVGYQLDRASLVRALRVCQIWHRSLVPVLWSAISIDCNDRRYTSPTSLNHWLDLLQPHVHYTRSLSLMVRPKRNSVFMDNDSDGNNHDHDHNDAHHLLDNLYNHHPSETADNDEDEEGHLRPLVIIGRILSLRHATNIQSITFQSASPIYYILPSAHRLASLERLDMQTLGGGPPELFLSDAFYAYPHLRHLRMAPFPASSSSYSSSSSSFPASPSSTTAGGGAPSSSSSMPHSGSVIITNPMHLPPKFLALQTLELYNVSWPAHDMLTFTARCPDLRALAITGRAKVAWDWTVETSEALVRHCPRLTALHLHPRFGTEVTEPVLVRLLERLPTATQLVKLSIPNCHFGTALYDLLMTIPYSAQGNSGLENEGGSGSGSGSGVDSENGSDSDDGQNGRRRHRRPRPRRPRRRIECLTTLNVSYTRMPGIFPRQLTSLLERAPNLRHLEAIGYLTTLKIGFAILGGDPSVARVIYRHLAQFEYLEHLCITPSHIPIRLGENGDGGGGGGGGEGEGRERIRGETGPGTRLGTRLGPSEQVEAGLEALATLRRLRIFDSHGTKGDMKDRRVIEWMAKHWPRLTTLQVFLGGGGGDSDDDSAEKQQEQHRRLVMRWFAEQGRYVQVLAA
ncbi:hypothetical protein DFQ27_006776 [Actinomortierella ambigua]|uniref:F-box domain-containing protein n=1 Tax=Actinomortierella ambigua TaxID=1343610 RepID=A0A9P6QHV5_9FUNG|nr:hypothetical protein DFQ27_006776 [Actinomortierella ambigua]